MRRRELTSVIGVVSFVLAACTSSDTTASPTTAVATATTVPPATSVAATTVAPATAATPEAQALELCSYETSFVLGQVENTTLDEASGLVASRQHPDVIWSHNDGGELPGLFAVAADGGDLGFHPLDVDVLDTPLEDVEDIAIVDGREGDGDDILLADIGDNGVRRPSIRIYRFAEPEPGSSAPISGVEVLEFVYPDRAHNAETLLVDQANDRVVIVTKEQRAVDGVPSDFGPTAPSIVFEGPLDGHGSGPIVLSPAGVLDMPALESRAVDIGANPATLLGFGGLPTGGDVAPDGDLVAIRTYETIWLWPRLAERSVAESLASDPCQVRVGREDQGEAVGFSDGRLVTVSEGVNQPLLELRP